MEKEILEKRRYKYLNYADDNIEFMQKLINEIKNKYSNQGKLDIHDICDQLKYLEGQLDSIYAFVKLTEGK